MTSPTHQQIADEVEPWLQQCGSCDAALPMACTCPPGDYRTVLLKVWQAYTASRAAMAEEIVRAIPAHYIPVHNIGGADPIPSDPTEWDEALHLAAQLAREIGSRDAS